MCNPAGDLAFALGHLATVPVRWNGCATTGYRNQEGDVVPDGLGRVAKVDRESVFVRCGSLPNLTSEKDIEVNGRTRRLREILPHDDGLILELILA